MFLTYEQELDRAEPNPPFATAAEGHAWQRRWCGTCQHERNCALLDVAIVDGQTPFGWVQALPGDLQYQYVCAEYRTLAPGKEDHAPCS